MEPDPEFGILRFGDTKLFKVKRPNEPGGWSWYSGADGKKVECSMDVTDILWEMWKESGSRRVESERYVIYEFKEPVYLRDYEENTNTGGLRGKPGSL